MVILQTKDGKRGVFVISREDIQTLLTDESRYLYVRLADHGLENMEELKIQGGMSDEGTVQAIEKIAEARAIEAKAATGPGDGGEAA
jgi:hypothetical protein